MIKLIRRRQSSKKPLNPMPFTKSVHKLIKLTTEETKNRAKRSKNQSKHSNNTKKTSKNIDNHITRKKYHKSRFSGN